ncbi:MAG: hypothetical protein KY458_13455, partial [Actinobacteria bacterium]|nr:hypothetical protein [Actinomycetota bacterium]
MSVPIRAPAPEINQYMRNGDVTSPAPEPPEAGPRRWRRSELLLAAGLGVAGTVAALLQLFWGQHIGLADNGDGFRLMCHFDLVKRVDVLGSRVVLHYAP